MKKRISFHSIYSQGLEFYLLKGINDDGQTYGLESDGFPNLIAAQRIDGTYGYVLRDDLYSEPEFKSPKEALAWQEQHQGKRVIPLYTSDGSTIIGEFELVSSDEHK